MSLISFGIMSLVSGILELKLFDIKKCNSWRQFPPFENCHRNSGMKRKSYWTICQKWFVDLLFYSPWSQVTVAQLRDTKAVGVVFRIWITFLTYSYVIHFLTREATVTASGVRSLPEFHHFSGVERGVSCRTLTKLLRFSWGLGDVKKYHLKNLKIFR